MKPPAFSSLVTFTVAALASLAPAQRTWVVDQNNGAGTDFLDLPPAIAAASDGDTIVVRDGNSSYGASTFGNKTLTVLGEGSPMVSGLTVTGLATNKVLAIKRLSTLGFQLTGNGGRILLENFGASPLGFFAASMTDCRLVTMNRCSFGGLTVRDSTLVFAQSNSSPVTTSSIGMSLSNSDVTFISSAVSGSSASCTFAQIPPTRAMDISGGTLVLTGATRISAGRDDPLCFSHPATSAISCGGGTIHVDPGVVISPTNGGAPISGSCTVIHKSIPAVSATGVAPGSSLNSDVYAPAGHTSFLLISLPTFNLPTPWCPLWLSVTHFPIDSGPIPPSGHRPHSFTLNSAITRGLPLTLQAVTISPTNVFKLSAPAVVVLD